MLNHSAIERIVHRYIPVQIVPIPLLLTQCVPTGTTLKRSTGWVGGISALLCEKLEPLTFMSSRTLTSSSREPHAVVHQIIIFSQCNDSIEFSRST